MKNKRERLGIISEVLRLQVIGSQEELLEQLREKGFDITQATLSRDLNLISPHTAHCSVWIFPAIWQL